MLTFNFDFFEKSSTTSFCKNYAFSDKNKPHLGTLFLILQIDTEKSKAQKIAEILSEILKHEYFKKEENIATNFEFALSRANQTMSALAEEGHIEWLNKFHALIAVIYDNQIHLASAGKTLACLFRDKETINIVEGHSSQKSPSIMKTFVNIISGNLKNGDKLFFATPRVVDYFSWEKIKRITQKPNISEAKESFLSDISPEFEPMGFAIFKINEKAPIFERKPSEQILRQSVQISPTLPKAPLLSQKPQQILPEAYSTKISLIKTKEIVAKNLKEIQNFTTSLFNRFKSSKKTFETPKTSAVKFNLESGKKSAFFSNLIKFLKTASQSLLQKFQHLAPLSRILLIVALLFIIALVVNITRATISKKDKNLNTQLEKTLSLVQEKEKQASDALIYNDYKKAKKLLLEAKYLAEKDLLSSKKYKEQGESLLSKIESNLDKTDKIIRLKDITTIVNLEAAKIEASDIIALSGEIFVFDINKNTLYKFNKETNEFSQFAKNDKLKDVVLAAPNEAKNTILFLIKKFDLYELVIETKNLQALEISFPTGVTDFKDIQSYSERLYVLSPSSNQLYRHQRTNSGYTQGSEWFLDTKNLDIKNAVSFTIDGSIYILKSNGKVLKFLNAEKEEFAMPELAIPVSNPTKIATDITNEFVYILEPKEKRLLVLDKKGSLRNQYLSDEFANLKGIYADEKEKKMYLLTDKKLLEVKLEK
jgi:hypothetical protein